MSKRQFAIGLIVTALFAAFAGFLQAPQVTIAQVTATPTATSAATNTPTPTATMVNTPQPLLSDPATFAAGYRVGSYAGGATPVMAGSAFQIYEGASIDIYSTTGRNTFRVNGETGDVTAYGSIIATTGININCAKNNITGTLTATPIAGATPVNNPVVSIAAITGDAAHPYGSYTGGVFTLGVMNTALTPTANTTPVAVEWCYVYTK